MHVFMLLVKSGRLSGRHFGNNCSLMICFLGISTQVSIYVFVQPLGFWSGNFSLIAPFPLSTSLHMGINLYIKADTFNNIIITNSNGFKICR